MLKKIIPFILFFCFAQNLISQLSQQAEISLITCRPGDEIYSTFGHTAIRVQDPTRDMDILYNYGMFSFDEPNFTAKFLRGKLEYWLGIESYRSFINSYSNEKRTVIEQKLKLDFDQRNQVFRALRNNLKPENRKYLYDFFFDNCSTRPRDILIDNISDISFGLEAYPPSFRELISQYTVNKPWTDFGIDLIVGSVADRKASVRDQMFLPEYLMHHFDRSGKVGGTDILLDYEKEAATRKHSPWFSPVLFFALILLLEIYLFIKFRERSHSYIRSYDKTFFTLLGIGGLLLLFMWFGTDHIATKQNMNILWMHPLYFFLLKAKNKKGFIYLLIGLALLALIQLPFFQELHMASVMLILVCFLKLLRKLKTQSISAV